MFTKDFMKSPQSMRFTNLENRTLFITVSAKIKKRTGQRNHSTLNFQDLQTIFKSSPLYLKFINSTVPRNYATIAALKITVPYGNNRIKVNLNRKKTQTGIKYSLMSELVFLSLS